MSDTKWFYITLIVVQITMTLVIVLAPRIDGMQRDCPKEPPQTIQPKKVQA